MFDTLISSRELRAHLDDPGWRICDCRFVLTQPEAGAAAWRAGHIPGAVYLHLDHDLAGPVTPDSGRHPLPKPEQFAATLARMGVGAHTQLVAYDDVHGAFAARLWWLARWLGHSAVAVLDGGWQDWLHEGGAVATAEVSPRSVPQFVAQRDDTRWVSSDTVLALVKEQAPGCLLDARAADRFQGRNETLDPVAGHVPGAVSLPFAGNIGSDGRFKSASELRQRFTQALAGIPPEQAICMCGSGVTACHNLLAMEHAGLAGARLYAGSWSEWIRDPARPVATGE